MFPYSKIIYNTRCTPVETCEHSSFSIFMQDIGRVISVPCICWRLRFTFYHVKSLLNRHLPASSKWLFGKYPTSEIQGMYCTYGLGSACQLMQQQQHSERLGETPPFLGEEHNTHKKKHTHDTHKLLKHVVPPNTVHHHHFLGCASRTPCWNWLLTPWVH